MVRWLAILSLCVACSSRIPPPTTGFLVYVRDREGSVLAAVDDRGKVLQSADTDGFGLNLSASGTPVPRAFLDKEVDEETGYLVFPSRYYDPATAQWISPDPKLLATLDCSGRVQDCNPYAFAGDRPLAWTDADGRASIPFIDAHGRPGMIFTLGFFGPDAAEGRTLALEAARNFRGPVQIVVLTAIYQTAAEIPQGLTRVEADRSYIRPDGQAGSATDRDCTTIHLGRGAFGAAASAAAHQDELTHELIHSRGNFGEGYVNEVSRSGQSRSVSRTGSENGYMGNYNANPEAVHLTVAEASLLMSPTDPDAAKQAFGFEDASFVNDPTFVAASSADDLPAASK